MSKCILPSKLYSGEYQATNPPKWVWICELCGKVGRDTAHKVNSKDFKRFAQLMVRFHPEELWWASQVEKETH